MSEAQRLEAVQQLQILDTPPEERFDRIARLTAQLFGCPMASIGLLDDQRLWIKSAVGLEVEAVPRELAICTRVIEGESPLLVVVDARHDPRVQGHPMFSGERLALRFYVGRALHASDGSRVGTLAAFDTEPHEPSPKQLSALEDLAALVEAELARVDLVAAARALEAREQQLRLALSSSRKGVWDWEVSADRICLSPELRMILGYPPEETREPIEHWLARVHPQDTAELNLRRARAFSGQAERYEGEYRLRCADGEYRWFAYEVKAIDRDAAATPTRAIGLVADIHERRLAEQERLRENERMALAVQAGGVGIFELDLELGVLHWDARASALFGFAATEGAAPALEQVLAVLHPDDAPPVRAGLQRLRRGAGTLDVEHRVIWPDGSVHHLRMLGRVLKASPDAPSLLIGTCWDVTEARELQQQLSYQATHDALTGLYNRFEFEQRLKAAQRTLAGGQAHALCFIDLDRFKIINDTAGHAAGDALLRELGTSLAKEIRSSDVLARLGGDEFGLLLIDCSGEQAERLAQALIQRIEALRFQWQGRTYDISASVGIAQLTAGVSIADVMSQADVACYAAKTGGRGRVSLYRSAQSEAVQHHRELLAASTLREALEADRFCLYAQAICDTGATAEPKHYELLVRMRGAGGELVPPNAFIPAAERYGLMTQIDRWVLRDALERQAPRLAAAGLTVSINLSARSLDDPTFLPFIEALVQASPLPAASIHFEITETAAVTHLTAAGGVLAALRRLGCALALDDFGSGLSSFSYLKHFRVDYVKIDGSFVRALKTSQADRDIVEAMHQIAHKLGARTIAEYVEDEEILALVGMLGIDYAQGYGIARPEPLDKVLKALEMPA